MTFIDRWPAWLRWLVLLPAAYAMFWLVALVLTIGQALADGAAPGLGFLYGFLSKFLSAVLPPALVVLVAWRVAPRARLGIAWAATAVLVTLHAIGVASTLIASTSGRSAGPDPVWWTLTGLALGAAAAVVGLVTAMNMEAADRKQASSSS